MRDWTKTLPNASYRGQPFFIEREELANAGRKVAEHEYAKSEDHDTEDMGRKVRHFRFTAYIVGDNADTDAQAFIELCSTAG
ncbi:DNA circularization N-terminal domain-containing protein, partial [Beijerinckia sp. L45]|uniref:DNA circularization N-terminal domain-containing protein n=1 Tax=Beijerinckia sp. L45 TaxID=1641855 RepID=UPI0015771ABA